MKLRRQRERTDVPTAVTAPSAEDGPLVPPAVLVAACTQALGLQIDGANPALLVLDVEGVGTTTEQGGIAARDELLGVITQRLLAVVGDGLMVARLGDHEFAVLFDDLRDPRVALDLAQRIVSTVPKPVFLTSQRRAALVVSCGIAAHDVIGKGAGAGELLRAADLAMREAKRAGHNRVEVCTAELIVTADERLSIGQDLRQALTDRGLGVSYQPLVDIRDGSLIGFEALVRWSHPVHGPISPDRFVPLAEEFGLITEIGALVLTTATAQVQQWAAAVGLPLTVHVNVSAVDLAAEGFVEMVGAALAESQLSPPQLVLELTESEIVRDLDSARERLAQLHELGVRVAVDDFGSGSSGMGYLQQLSVDILKVEEGSGEGVDRQRADDLLRGVIAFGKALGMQVFGERIEDDEQRARLLEHGCTVGQGYLFSRPLTPEDAGAYLRTEVLTA